MQQILHVKNLRDFKSSSQPARLKVFKELMCRLLDVEVVVAQLIEKHIFLKTKEKLSSSGYYNYFRNWFSDSYNIIIIVLTFSVGLLNKLSSTDSFERKQ